MLGGEGFAAIKITLLLQIKGKVFYFHFILGVGVRSSSTQGDQIRQLSASSEYVKH